MSTAVTVAIAVYLALITAAFAWIVRAWRRECRLADRTIRAQQRARLQQHMYLRRSPDTRPAPIDETCLQLEALYRAPAAERRTP
ncbi:hypothetical protein ACFWMG_05055 [Streptomyces sp. NPDC127074]|uniref:hypothetical protein n=1 Tax=Streptomyces sp. NPDC127074 TaxID=3347130 RepID=UPI003657179A